MKKFLIIYFSGLFLLFSNYSFTRDNTILTINNQSISSDELLRIYNKNKNTQVPDNKNIEDYLELFINYKLKVIEAQNLGLDTTRSFLDEYNGYIAQLEKPYLVDSSVEKEIVKESLERLNWEVKASHLLIMCNENALPLDTQKAYQKIVKLRQRAIKGEDFEKLILENSEEPNVADYKGNLGYFTAFQMVYPFEVAAYKTPVGTISQPVRTRYGYHILKVWDKRAARGEVQVAHIMLAYPKGSPAKVKDSLKLVIDSIYQKIQNGEQFDDLCLKYSDDRQSAERGGVLDWFGTGQMVPEFDEAAFGLKNNGDISKPVLTPFGWHIIKKINSRKPNPDAVKEKIKSMISQDERAGLGRKTLINNIKMELGFQVNKKSLEQMYLEIDSNIYKGNWKPSNNLQAVIFNLGNKQYTQNDFAQYIVNNQSVGTSTPLRLAVDRLFQQYVEKCVIDFERSRLKDKYPDFRYLSQEYHDGILLFNLSEQKVWNKAMKDTSGLISFYETNKNKHLYGERADAIIYTVPTRNQADIAYKLVTSDKKGKLTIEQLNKKVCKNDTIKNCIKIESGLYEKGTHALIDTSRWETSISGIIEKDGKFSFYKINQIRKPEPKLLDDSRGLHIADYQTYLDSVWISDLRKKYPVIINTELLQELKNQ